MKTLLKTLTKNAISFFKSKAENISLSSRRQEINYIKSNVVDLVLRSRLNGDELTVSEIFEILKHIEIEVEQSILDKKQKAIDLLEEIESNTVI
jgi:hypothetical protein